MEDEDHDEESQNEELEQGEADAAYASLNPHANNEDSEYENDFEEDNNAEDISSDDDEEDDDIEVVDDEEPDFSQERRMGRLRRLIANINRDDILRNIHLPFLRRLARNSLRGLRQRQEDSSGQTRPDNITFDQSLPAAHSYLGDMQETSGVQYLDETYITLPILIMNDFVLLPHQTLPLHLMRARDTALLHAVMDTTDKTFGILLSREQVYSSNGEITQNDPVTVGCTAEVRSIKHEESNEVDVVVAIVKGRQRFRVLKRRTQFDGNVMARVQILPEEEPVHPASAVKARSCYRNKWYHRNCAILTSWPPFVYDMYDSEKLRGHLFNELCEWFPKMTEKKMPASACELSFWIAANIPISNRTKLEIMSLDSTVQRLRMELDLLRKCTQYNCTNCQQKITDKAHVFSMSHTGPMAAYVNPGGVVHETLTVYKVYGLVHVSNPSTEHSWFPGYAWTICECSNCYHHIGWRFEAHKNKILVPQKFWGLSRSTLTPGTPETLTDPDLLHSSSNNDNNVHDLT